MLVARRGLAGAGSGENGLDAAGLGVGGRLRFGSGTTGETRYVDALLELAKLAAHEADVENRDVAATLQSNPGTRAALAARLLDAFVLEAAVGPNRTIRQGAELPRHGGCRRPDEHICAGCLNHDRCCGLSGVEVAGLDQRCQHEDDEHPSHGSEDQQVTCYDQL